MELFHHEFGPVYDSNSRILILGSFPSVKSRETCFYYGHPQNRFWKVLAALTEETVPSTVEEKTAFLLRQHIAVWDVIESCEINGSSDTSIRRVRPNDITRITSHAPIRHIYANGTKAWELFVRHCQAGSGLPLTRLPSTSPANAAYSLNRLIEEWRCILTP